MIKIAQSTIGFSDNKNQDADPAENPTTIEAVLPLVKENGYDGVEIWEPHVEGKSDEELSVIRRQIDDLGLEVPMLSSYFNFTKNEERAAASMEKARQVIHEAKILGAKEIRTFTGGDRSAEASQEQWDRGITCLQTLCDEAADVGVGLCLHTHDWNLVDTIAGCEKTLTLVNRPNCTLLHKPAWFMPEQDWTLEFLGKDISTVQVTVHGTESGQLADGSIDYKSQMLWFARNDQPVWFNFTWMADGAAVRCREAAPYLLACREAVLARIG